MAGRALRLAKLLRGLGIEHSDIAQHDSKSMVAKVRTAYYQRAKEEHPDLAPQEQKAEAGKAFVKLHQDFKDAVKLLEDGVKPYLGGSSPESFHQHTYMYEAVDFSERFGQKRPQQFDTKTRIKGHLIFWSSLVSFMVFMREFLVWSAGSTYSWYRPPDLNPFSLRRYQPQGEWKGLEKCAPKEEKETTKSQAEQKPAPKKDVDPFYAKRGVGTANKGKRPSGYEAYRLAR